MLPRSWCRRNNQIPNITILPRCLWKNVRGWTQPKFSLFHLECTDKTTFKWLQQANPTINFNSQPKFTIMNTERNKVDYISCQNSGLDEAHYNRAADNSQFPAWHWNWIEIIWRCAGAVAKWRFIGNIEIQCHHYLIVKNDYGISFQQQIETSSMRFFIRARNSKVTTGNILSVRTFSQNSHRRGQEGVQANTLKDPFWIST